MEPDVTFLIFVSVLTLSPGLILSGEYPTKKSLLSLRLECFSIIGMQTSSVAPGKTVDSNITTHSSVIISAISLLAFFNRI